MKPIFVLLVWTGMISGALAYPLPSSQTSDIISFAHFSEDELTFCGQPNNPCWLAERTAIAVTDAIAESRKSRDRNSNVWCSDPSTPCAPKVEALAHSLPQDDSSSYGVLSDFCGTPGTMCRKERSALERITRATENLSVTSHHLKTRAPSLPKYKRMNVSWNNFWHMFSSAPGRASFCGAPGGTCKRKRDAGIGAVVDPNWLAAANQAIALLNAVAPQILSDLCFTKGGECHSILQAHEAWSQIHSRSNGAPNSTNGKTAQLCFGPQGACTLARRALQNLEEVINAAVDGLEHR